MIHNNVGSKSFTESAYFKKRKNKQENDLKTNKQKTGLKR